ncbi:hypothetical protein C8Q72DRAFT_788566, partial [Fomitopsis betulina]
QVGQITLDNASNCNTMMEHLEELLHEFDPTIPFHRNGNHIWYYQAVYGDVLARARQLVSVFRSSGPGDPAYVRPLSMATAQKELLNGGELLEVQLLRDCETCWSSVFLMVVRILTLWPALQSYAASAATSSTTTLNESLLTAHERRVLRDLYYVLCIPHQAQELLSSENTPTTSYMLTVYEMVISGWENLKVQPPHLSTCIDAGISKLEEYITYAHATQVYALSMILNPEMKFSWIQQHWSPSEQENAEKWILDTVRPTSGCSKIALDCTRVSYPDAAIPYAQGKDNRCTQPELSGSANQPSNQGCVFHCKWLQ